MIRGRARLSLSSSVRLDPLLQKRPRSFPANARAKPEDRQLSFRQVLLPPAPVPVGLFPTAGVQPLLTESRSRFPATGEQRDPWSFLLPGGRFPRCKRI